MCLLNTVYDIIQKDISKNETEYNNGKLYYKSKFGDVQLSKGDNSIPKLSFYDGEKLETINLIKKSSGEVSAEYLSQEELKIEYIIKSIFNGVNIGAIKRPEPEVIPKKYEKDDTDDGDDINFGDDRNSDYFGKRMDELKEEYERKNPPPDPNDPKYKYGDGNYNEDFTEWYLLMDETCEALYNRNKKDDSYGDYDDDDTDSDYPDENFGKSKKSDEEIDASNRKYIRKIERINGGPFNYKSWKKYFFDRKWKGDDAGKPNYDDPKFKKCPFPEFLDYLTEWYSIKRQIDGLYYNYKKTKYGDDKSWLAKFNRKFDEFKANRPDIDDRKYIYDIPKYIDDSLDFEDKFHEEIDNYSFMGGKNNNSKEIEKEIELFNIGVIKERAGLYSKEIRIYIHDYDHVLTLDPTYIRDSIYFSSYDYECTVIEECANRWGGIKLDIGLKFNGKYKTLKVEKRRVGTYKGHKTYELLITCWSSEDSYRELPNFRNYLHPIYDYKRWYKYEMKDNEIQLFYGHWDK